MADPLTRGCPNPDWSRSMKTLFSCFATAALALASSACGSLSSGDEPAVLATLEGRLLNTQAIEAPASMRVAVVWLRRAPASPWRRTSRWSRCFPRTSSSCCATFRRSRRWSTRTPSLRTMTTATATTTAHQATIRTTPRPAAATRIHNGAALACRTPTSTSSRQPVFASRWARWSRTKIPTATASSISSTVTPTSSSTASLVPTRS